MLEGAMNKYCAIEAPVPFRVRDSAEGLSDHIRHRQHGASAAE